MTYKQTIPLALLLGAVGAGMAEAQERPAVQAPRGAGQLRGSVLDAGTGQPLRSASVELRGADSTLVAGALTGVDGRFNLQGLRPGRYRLRVSALGHQPVTRAGITITPSAPDADVGAVRLAASALAIEGLTVTAERQAAALAPDRNTYSVRDLPSAAGGTAVDALRNVPSVEVDVDGRVSLRGNENVVVQINGRPSPMRGEQLGAFLSQLPAGLIDRVEVISNPSARFDPEGMAGIVNVVLRQNTDLGTSGGFTVGGGSTGQASLSGNLGHQSGPWTLFGSYGFQRDQRDTDGFSLRENFFATATPFREQRNSGTVSPLSHTFTGSVDRKVGSRGLLNTSLLFNTRTADRDDLNRVLNLDAARLRTGERTQRISQTGDDLNLDYVLGYRHTIRPRQHELATELRFNREVEDERTFYTRETLFSTGTTDADLPLRELQDARERGQNWTLTADYTRPLGSGVRLETGYRGTMRSLDNDLVWERSTATSEALEADPGRTNAFVFDERVHAAYAVVGGTTGRLSLQGGLRAERASTGFDLATTGERFDNDYGSFFPSALVAFNLTDERQVKASYSKRVERPRTWQLNPFGRVEDELNLSVGNPALSPEYTHAFEVGFQQSGDVGTFQVTPFYRHTTNTVRRYTTVDRASGIATSTFRNANSTDSYGTDLNVSLRRGRLTGFGGLSAFRQVTDAGNIEAGAGADAFGWSARANATLRITPRLDAQGFLMYRAPQATEQGRVSGRSMFNMALRQKLMGDRASLTLRVVDPFDRMRFRSFTDDDDFRQETERRMGARGVFLSFNYNFGQQPRTRTRDTQDRGGDDEETP